MTALPRILFYCHNLFGLGHIRRSTRIAEACADLGARCRIVTGCRSLDAIRWDERLELERLPALEVGSDQQFFEAGHPDRTDVMERRAEQIRRSTQEFDPDFFIVDYLPGGLGGELLGLGKDDSGLPEGCEVIWGVPYTKRITRPKSPPRNPRIRRWMNRFNAVIAYTDAQWEDPLAPLVPGGLPERRFFSGFLTGQPKRTSKTSGEIVVVVGGGREALVMAPLIRNALRAAAHRGEFSVRCVVGPLGDAKEVEAILGDFARIDATGAVEDAVEGAQVVIARCGYNSSYTLLRSEAPVIFLPQISPCYEQIDRAESLRTVDRVQVIREDEEEAASLLLEAVRSAMGEPHHGRNLPFSVDEGQSVARWLFDRYEGSR